METNNIITQEDILTYARVLNKVNNYDKMMEALKLHNEFLSLLLGIFSLERIERFDLLEQAKDLFQLYNEFNKPY